MPLIMKKYLIVLFLLITVTVSSRDRISLSENTIIQKMDSIKAEGNELYAHEIASWVATDLAREDVRLKNEYGSYLTYFDSGKIKSVIIDKDLKNVLGEYEFQRDSMMPVKEIVRKRTLSDTETNLMKVRENIFHQLADEKYAIKTSRGFNPNLIVLPFQNGYKAFLIFGTSEPNIIPLGNDYYFRTDASGKITEWRKLHAGFIPLLAKDNTGRTAKAIVHNHLQGNTFISSTDICTFKLYGTFLEVDECKVYSFDLNCVFTYNRITDTLTKE